MLDFPNSPTTGQIYNSGTGPIYIWDGVAWSLVTQATRTARQNNLVVNPAMAVSQEQGAASGNAVAGFYPADQWVVNGVGTVCSVQQVTSYTPDLSPNRLRKTVTALKASLAASDLIFFNQRIEGLRVACLGHGSAAACQSVLRFGFKGPAGVYSVSLRNVPTTRSYVKNFTISAAQANTDTTQVFVIPGDTTGTWAIDNTASFDFGIADAVGTTFQGVEGWQAGNFLGTAANSNMVATNGNVVELFDVGLYPDPEKTGLPPPFIAPIYSDALIDCQRYFEAGQDGTDSYTAATGYVSVRSWFKVAKRINPTVTGTFNGSQTNTSATFSPDFLNVNNFRMAKQAIATGVIAWQQTWNASARM